MPIDCCWFRRHFLISVPFQVDKFGCTLWIFYITAILSTKSAKKASRYLILMKRSASNTLFEISYISSSASSNFRNRLWNPIYEGYQLALHVYHNDMVCTNLALVKFRCCRELTMGFGEKSLDRLYDLSENPVPRSEERAGILSRWMR